MQRRIGGQQLTRKALIRHTAVKNSFIRWGVTRFRPEFDKKLVTSRIKELWQANIGRAEILRILQAEGFDITAHYVEEIRKEQGWMMKPGRSNRRSDSSGRRSSSPVLPSSSPPPLRIEMRYLDSPAIQGTSLQKKPKGWQKSRGRVTPHSKSQLPAGEARRRLSIDPAAYKNIRDVFQLLCRQRDITVKSEAPDADWQEAKRELVSRLPELRKVMHQEQGDVKCRHERELALDIVCATAARDALRSTWNPGPVASRKILGISLDEWREAMETLYKLIDASGTPFMMDLSPQQRLDMQKEWAKVSPTMAKLVGRRPSPDDDDAQQWNKAYKCLFTNAFSQYRLQRRRELIQDTKGADGTAGRKSRASRTRKKLPMAAPQRSYSSRQQQDSSEEEILSEGQDEAMSEPYDEDMSDTDDESTTRPASYGMKSLPGLAPEQQETYGGKQVPTSPASITWESSRIEYGMSDSDEEMLEPAANKNAKHQEYGSKGPRISPEQEQPDEDQDAYQDTDVDTDEEFKPKRDYLLRKTKDETHDLRYRDIPPDSDADSDASSSPLAPATAPPPYVAYMRLHPTSAFYSAKILWVAIVSSGSLDGLRGAAANKFPGTACSSITGIVKDGRGSEAGLRISDEDELAAYLEHVGDSPPTFSVQLVWKAS